MGIFESKKLDCQAKFISISETVELILQYETDQEHIKNVLNIKFIKNQTCLHKDGYDLEPIIIDNDSNPDYSDIRQAVIDKLENKPNDWLHDYGFGRKRLYSELEKLGIFVDYDLSTQAKSFFVDDDYQDETGAYRECLPHEYALLYKDYQELEKKYQELLDNQNQDMVLNEKSKSNYLITIGILLELCQTKKYTSQADIINAITDMDIQGQKERILQNRFSDANKALEQARKK